MTNRWLFCLCLVCLSFFVFFSLTVEMKAVSIHTWPCWKSSCPFHDCCLEFESPKNSLSHLTPHSASMWAAPDRMIPHFPPPPLWWAIVCFPLLSSYIHLSQKCFLLVVESKMSNIVRMILTQRSRALANLSSICLSICLSLSICPSARPSIYLIKHGILTYVCRFSFLQVVQGLISVSSRTFSPPLHFWPSWSLNIRRGLVDC